MTAIIANDTLSGMGDMGTDLGDFLGNFSGGFGKFLITMAILGGIAGLLGAIIYFIRKKIKM